MKIGDEVVVVSVDYTSSLSDHPEFIGHIGKIFDIHDNINYVEIKFNNRIYGFHEWGFSKDDIRITDIQRQQMLEIEESL